jgi:hypothetical protein
MNFPVTRDEHDARRGIKAPRGELVERITMQEANARLDLGDLGLEQHYLGPSRYRGDFALSNVARSAIAIFRPPIAASFNRALVKPLELSRLLATIDRAEPLSAFLSGCMQHLRRTEAHRSCVVSYTDPSATNSGTGQSHVGGVYRAANFVDCGLSPAAEPHWLDEHGTRINRQAVVRLLGTGSRARVASARPAWQYVAGTPKRLFVYPLAHSVADVLARLNAVPRAARTRRFSFAVVPPYRPWE